MRTWILGMAAIAAVSLASARADETKIPLDQVPKTVMDAVNAKFPTGKITGAEKDVEKDKTTYEIGVTLGDRKMDVSLKPDGTIIEIEETIAIKDLPKTVAAAVTTKYPKGKIKSAELVTKGDVSSYEVIVTLEGKKSREMSLDAKGKILEDEVEGEDD